MDCCSLHAERVRQLTIKSITPLLFSPTMMAILTRPTPTTHGMLQKNAISWWAFSSKAFKTASMISPTSGR